MTRIERIILLILACLNFTHVLDFMIMMPLGNFLMPQFQIGPRFFSWIVAAYPVTACVSGLISAFYVDQYDRKKVLLFAYSGFLIGTFCCGISPNEVILLIARVLTGFFGGLIGAQVFSIIADIFVYEKRGRAMGSIFMAFSVASVVGVPFSLYLANHFSWHAPFIFIALLGLPVLLLIARFLPPMHSHLVGDRTEPFRPNLKKVIVDIVTHQSQLTALLLSGFLMMGHFLIIPFINPYLEFNQGYHKSQIPMIYVVGGICAFVSSLVVGRLADRYGKFRVYAICLIVSLLPIYFITHLPDIPYWSILGIFGFWFTFATARNIPAQAMISTVVIPAQRGQFMSFNSSFQQLFTGLASVISGVIVTKGGDGKLLHYDIVGYLSIAVVFLCLFIGQNLARKESLK